VRYIFPFLSKKLITTKTVLGILGLVAILSWFPYFYRPDGKLHVTFFDVGQGDAILIETPLNQQILVDAGPDGTIIEHLSRSMPFYDRILDLIVLTHPHADHLTGLIDVFRRFEVDTVALTGVDYESEVYETFKETLKKQQIKIINIGFGDVIDFGGGLVGEVWWPRSIGGKPPFANINNASIVLKLDYKDFEVVLTGDAENDVLEEILDLIEIEEEIEVLKVPHHGAKTALNEEFIEIIEPKLAVISVGERNRYGHPAEEVIDFFESIGTKILRTDKDGTIEVMSNGSSWRIL